MNKEMPRKWAQRWATRGLAHSLKVTNWIEDKRPVREDAEEGSTTVEYAIGAVATAGFAGLLLAVLKSGGVKTLITNIIQSALSI